jgi:hypothetical protein
MENRPKIRVTPEAYATIQGMAKKGNRSMTKQVSQILALVSHPQDGMETIDGMAVITRIGDKTIVTETGERNDRKNRT